MAQLTVSRTVELEEGRKILEARGLSAEKFGLLIRF
jgi:hypothetical protein